MRVLIVSDSLRPYESGVGTVIDEIIGILNQHEVVLVGPNHPSLNGSEVYEVKTIRLASIPLLDGYRSCISVWYKRNEMIELARWADVILHETISSVTFAFERTIRPAGVETPAIVHMHTQYVQYARDKFPGILGKLAAMYERATVLNALDLADNIICPGDYYHSLMEKDLKKPFAVGLTWPSPVILPTADNSLSLEQILKMELKGDEKVVCYCGRIRPEKNTEELLRISANLIKRDPTIRVVLTGDGDISGAKEFWASLRGDPKKICFTGNIDRAVLARLYQFAVMGITVSLTEAQGLGLLEQGASGLPMAARKGTCFEEVIRKSGGGILLDERVSDSAWYICDVINHPFLAKELGMAAKKYITANYSREKLGNDFLSFLTKVAAGH